MFKKSQYLLILNVKINLVLYFNVPYIFKKELMMITLIGAHPIVIK